MSRDDFDFAPADSRIVVREADCFVYWVTPRGAYSMGYPDMDRAWVAFDFLTHSLSVRSASLYHGTRLIERHDYDPYAWHDPRTVVGR